MLIEGIFKPKKYKALDQLLEFIQSDEFPYFLTHTDANYENVEYREEYVSFLSHTIRQRRYDEETNFEGKPNSQYTEHFDDLFLEICRIENVKVNTIHRAGVNVTFGNNLKRGFVHLDHEFPHYVFIYYVNSWTNGSTFLFDESKKKLIHEVKAKKNKYTFFGPSTPHAQGFCKAGEKRIAIVYTFS